MWRRKYGEDHVRQIITFGTMAAHGRDPGRGPRVGHELCAKRITIAKLVPFDLGMTLEKALKL